MTDHASTQSTPLLLQQTLSPSTLSDSPAWSLSFSLDGNFLAVCFGNPGTCIKIWRHINGTDDTPRINNGNVDKSEEEWKLVTTIRSGHARTIRDVAFAPLSATGGVLILASASFDGRVMIWECNIEEAIDADYDDEREIFEPIAQLEGHENEVKHLAWNQTGSLLASCGRDKTVWVWECFLPGTVGGCAANRGQVQQDDGEFECLAVLQGHDGRFILVVM